ncbi:MAG: hypothetical protein SOZ83_04885 [Sphaerochaetaceae bacterium]|nr:hypothetical protein [Sphaerochaetaceae bacterium]
MFFLNHLDNMQPSSLKILFYLLNLLNQYLILRLSTLSKTNNQPSVKLLIYSFASCLVDLKKVRKWYFNLYEVITFSQALSDTELYGIIEDEMASFAGSDDGFTIKKRCKFFIFLNDRKPKNRIRFTIDHNLGHI